MTNAMSSGFSMKQEEGYAIKNWVASLGLNATNNTEIGILSVQQGWGKLGMGRSIINEPLCLAGKTYGWGLGTHADSEIVLRCTKPIKTFRVQVGVDQNMDSIKSHAEMMFSVWVHGRCITQSQYLNVESLPECLTANMDGATEFTLKVKAKDSTFLAHGDWAEAEAITSDGETLRIGDPAMASIANCLPVSFQYNGMNSEQWFRKWRANHTQQVEEEYTAHQFSCQDHDTGLECTVELQEYTSFPACLWNVRFKNNGKTETKILQMVNALDLSWPCLGEKRISRARGAFNYADSKGGEAFRDNFMMLKDNLKTPITMGGVGGRPSVDWMPYFNFEGENEGLMFGIGWTGQWHSEISPGFDSVRFRAGMENIHTNLQPGETIRQPSVLMIYWQGSEPIRGHNLLRQFIRENLAPRDEHGQTIQAPACNLTWGGMIAKSHLARIKNLESERIPVDCYWIDAGWYGKTGPNTDEFAPEWASQAGDWSANQETFPYGLKEVSDATHAAHKKFLLWVEPERAIYGTPITLEHPNWFLGAKKLGQNVLLNLGNPEARKWCTELIAGLIVEQGIDCYRQDFNIDPLAFWQGNDSPDRIGISEIRYIEGLYTFLAELRLRFPNLLIDNCASGGRRLDFEMMRYSIPLWASDMQCAPDYLTERNQQQVHGLSYWLPQFSFGTQDHAGDTYHFRSTLAAGLNIHLFSYERCPIKQDYPYQWLRERLSEYHRTKEYFAGDFYPLFDQTDSMKYWAAYQFYRPDLNAGIILAFRKSNSSIEKVSLELRGLDALSSYEVEDADSQAVETFAGRDLMQTGLPIEIKDKRQCRLFFLRAARLSNGCTPGVDRRNQPQRMAQTPAGHDFF